MKVREGAGLLVASPILVGFGCCLTPFIVGGVTVIVTLVSLSASELINVLMHNKQTALITFSIAVSVAGGVLLFQYFRKKQ